VAEALAGWSHHRDEADAVNDTILLR